MTLKTLAILAIFVTSIGSAPQMVQAQGNIPANFPPASYKGAQFVDNKGCVFVRAGYDGAVTWVPRVTRQRKQICGQTPTLGGRSVQAAAPAPAAKPAPKPAPRATTRPVQITLAPQPKPEIPVVAPSKPAPRQIMQTTTTAPKPIQITRPVPQVVRAPASKPVMAAPPRVVRAPAAWNRAPVTWRVANRAPAAVAAPKPTFYSACRQGQGMRTADGRALKINCGPQATTLKVNDAAPVQTRVTYGRSWDDSLDALPGSTRIMPKRAYENLMQSKGLYVPTGYRKAWSDDRLNPYRAVQTVQGYRQTQALWTNRVPRRNALSKRNHKTREPNVVGRGGRLPFSNPSYDFE
ncbi:MAG: hypothetical protein N4A61_07390 [Pelagimonas sp.]|jgi:hypothetical protein|nr:hypothetical protein [Pelagimonas sp.]